MTPSPPQKKIKYLRFLKIQKFLNIDMPSGMYMCLISLKNKMIHILKFMRSSFSELTFFPKCKQNCLKKIELKKLYLYLPQTIKKHEQPYSRI